MEFYLSLLFKVLVRNNLMLLIPALLAGTGIYVLTDLFERLDVFIGSGLGFSIVVKYYFYKIPLIVSQILPVVFLIAAVVQLCLMVRSREMVALQAGGISPLQLLKILFVCGLVWSSVQLLFSQYLGVSGENESQRIWREDVRNKEAANKVLHNVWFANSGYIVSLSVIDSQSKGSGFLAYKLSDDSLSLEEIITAPSFYVEDNNWIALNGTKSNPNTYKQESFDKIQVAIDQEVSSLRIIQSGSNPQLLTIWELSEAIENLKNSGSNVEILQTAWHSKIAYAASIAVMTFVAIAIVSWQNNIYIAIGCSLVSTLLYYVVFILSNALGESGSLSPFLATWLANIIAVTLASLRIIKVYWQRN